jgi:hypothetical protein
LSSSKKEAFMRSLAREVVLPVPFSIDAIKSRGLYVSLHCCGNIEALMPDIVECGVDVFDPFQLLELASSQPSQ